VNEVNKVNKGRIVQQYLDLLKRIMTEGEDVPTGAYLESEKRQPAARTILAAQFRHDLRDGFPAVTTKRLYFDSVVKELLWFLRGETNVNTLGCKIWDQWASNGNANLFPEAGECGPIYGATWRHWPYPADAATDAGRPLWEATNHSAVNSPVTFRTCDQIAAVVRDLRAVAANPADRARRRIILSGWNPPLVPLQGLPPCHTLAQWLPTNGVLHCHCFWRSIDAFTGMPFNIASYALLTHLLAFVTGYEVGQLVASITDLHIYDNQQAMVREQLTRKPYRHPHLILSAAIPQFAPDLAIEHVRKWLTPEMVSLIDYKCHPPLRCEVAV
jgi:thymidylate synthase